jgi:SulP family sulfate permease
MVAGLPAEAGLYASIVPAIAYAALGSSRVLAVGPVAVISLMTASALGGVVERHGVGYGEAAMLLAALSGVVLLALGGLRMGWLANLLSHSVIAGFVAGSALLIAVGQLRHLLGVPGGGDTLVDLLPALAGGLGAVQGATAALGLGALVLLVLTRSVLPGALRRAGVPATTAVAVQRGGPVLAVVLGSVAVAAFGLEARGVAVVGAVPSGLPRPVLPPLVPGLIADLAVPAVLIAVVGFVESISVGQSLAMRRRQRVEPDRELLGLGAANLASGLSGGFPVTGGFSRSVVNADAGAVTPMAGALTGLGMGLVALLLTPAFHDLPRAVLAAVIVVAVLPLVDPAGIRRTLTTSPVEGTVLVVTAAGVLLVGVEAGIGAGVLLALGMHLARSSRPHLAVIGRVPGTEHFRNVERHRVETAPHLLCVRVDESLWFANARWLEDRILALVTGRPEVTDLVLQCSAVNGIDGSALHTLETINDRLSVSGVRFHLSEVKGPVMDGLVRAGFPGHLSGRVFFTQYEAATALAERPPPGRAPVAGDGDGI